MLTANEILSLLPSLLDLTMNARFQAGNRKMRFNIRVNTLLVEISMTGSWGFYSFCYKHERTGKSEEGAIMFDEVDCKAIHVGHIPY